MSVDDKSNEIPAVPELLKLLELKGATVTLDAMHCQTKTAKTIVDAEVGIGADYVLTVKGHQESLHDHLVKKFAGFEEDDFCVKGLRKHVTVEKSRGRNERREFYVIASDDAKVFARSSF